MRPKDDLTLGVVYLAVSFLTLLATELVFFGLGFLCGYYWARMED